MARIVLGFYMFRYPLGGMLAGSLQWLVGLQRAGHDVFVVEKAPWQGSCYDPRRDVMGDDCSSGIEIVAALLHRFDLGDRWCFIDVDGRYHGVERKRMKAIFDSADVFVDMGTHGTLLEEAERAGLRVLVDGEPGWTQMRMEMRLAEGESLPSYDAYYTVGQNIGTPASTAPTAGRDWRHVYHPVVVDLFSTSEPPPPSARFTTVMNWTSHEKLEYRGALFGQKDVEFARFVDLPSSTAATLEVAVSGKKVPHEELRAAGWHIRGAHETTVTYESFRSYVMASRGEFSVAKNVFVATRSGWFSDRSAAYLAAGRPAVLQDTGFSAHLPCGEGLFAVNTLEEAADALAELETDYARHSAAARELAEEYLVADRVLSRFLSELGL